MGMGVGRYIYPWSDLNAGSISICAVSKVHPWRENLGVPFLLVSSNDSLDGGAKWDDLFGAVRHGGTALSCDVP